MSNQEDFAARLAEAKAAYQAEIHERERREWVAFEDYLRGLAQDAFPENDILEAARKGQTSLQKKIVVSYTFLQKGSDKKLLNLRNYGSGAVALQLSKLVTLEVSGFHLIRAPTDGYFEESLTFTVQF